ncbi:hypothetical protein HK100_008294 [Physocladia obscura]|uniref:Uncharacterized protein n=1 Tax=Physocladia obscura TaxID=109957 RepID=A0AAD5SQU6_9FUNG|nr:hypothetical protein HK100_008294 [Physocladia obscura]
MSADSVYQIVTLHADKHCHGATTNLQVASAGLYAAILGSNATVACVPQACAATDAAGVYYKIACAAQVPLLVHAGSAVFSFVDYLTPQCDPSSLASVYSVVADGKCVTSPRLPGVWNQVARGSEIASVVDGQVVTLLTGAYNCSADLFSVNYTIASFGACQESLIYHLDTFVF